MWYVDIGDRVVTGQLLADIETPELDQELDQAKANLVSYKASLRLHASVSTGGKIYINATPKPYRYRKSMKECYL